MYITAVKVIAKKTLHDGDIIMDGTELFVNTTDIEKAKNLIVGQLRHSGHQEVTVINTRLVWVQDID